MPKKGVPTIIKNDIKLLWLIVSQKDKFSNPILNIKKDLGIKWMKPSDFLKKYIVNGKETRLFDRSNKEAYEKRIRFIEKLDSEKLQKLSKSIQQILEDNKLGNEWFNSIADIIISNYFCPPFYNFHIASDIKNKVSIEINATTSLEDIKKGWGFVKAKQLGAFGKQKKNYFSKKRSEHLTLLQLYKTIRSERPALEDTSIKKLYKIKDEDIVGILFQEEDDISEEADKKRVNLIRQIKHRLNNINSE